MAAVIDWELSTIGDPVADVAMMCAYRHPPFDLVMGAPSAWTSAAAPPAPELAAGYEAAGGVPLDDWEFHLALACFKVAVIAAGIDHRRRAGAGAGPGFDTAGDAVAPYLELRARRHRLSPTGSQILGRPTDFHRTHRRVLRRRPPAESWRSKIGADLRKLLRTSLGIRRSQVSVADIANVTLDTSSIQF